jgi:hypothetical protein
MKANQFFIFLIITVSSCSKFTVLKSRVEYPWTDRYELVHEPAMLSAQLPSFSKLWLIGEFDLTVSFGNETSIRIEGDRNLTDHFRYYVANGELRLHFDDVAKATGRKLKIELFCNSLTTIKKMGKGSLTMLNEIQSDVFSFSQSGSGTAFLKLNTGTTRLSQSGSGSILASGKAERVSKKISGSGSISWIRP